MALNEAGSQHLGIDAWTHGIFRVPRHAVSIARGRGIVASPVRLTIWRPTPIVHKSEKCATISGMTGMLTSACLGVPDAGSHDKAVPDCPLRFMIPAQTIQASLPRAPGGVT